jgi:cytochrome c biogenesis protein CcmG/thiol:disulfide interchange protein DsbE
VRSRVGALALGALLSTAACGSGGDAFPETSGGPVSAAGTQAVAGAASTQATAAGAANDKSVNGTAGPARCPVVEPGPAVKGGLPKLTLECLGGGPAVRLAALRGPLVLNIWASWCGPCADEVPHLLAARAALGSTVRFLGIDFTDKVEAAQEWLRFQGVTYPSLADPKGRVRAALRVPGPPVTLFVRSDGTVAETHYGAFTSAQEVLAAVAAHLGVRS